MSNENIILTRLEEMRNDFSRLIDVFGSCHYFDNGRMVDVLRIYDSLNLLCMIAGNPTLERVEIEEEEKKKQKKVEK